MTRYVATVTRDCQVRSDASPDPVCPSAAPSMHHACCFHACFHVACWSMRMTWRLAWSGEDNNGTTRDREILLRVRVRSHMALSFFFRFRTGNSFFGSGVKFRS